MTDLPAITDVQRYTYKPGDALIVRLDRNPNDHEADMIIRKVRTLLGHPDLRVIPTGPEVTIEVLADTSSQDAR